MEFTPRALAKVKARAWFLERQTQATQTAHTPHGAQASMIITLPPLQKVMFSEGGRNFLENEKIQKIAKYSSKWRIGK